MWTDASMPSMGYMTHTVSASQFTWKIGKQSLLSRSG